MPRVADITAELPQRDALVVRPTTAAPKVGAFFWIFWRGRCQARAHPGAADKAVSRPAVERPK